jgi:hypothetical protein
VLRKKNYKCRKKLGFNRLEIGVARIVIEHYAELYNLCCNGANAQPIIITVFGCKKQVVPCV